MKILEKEKSELTKRVHYYESELQNNEFVINSMRSDLESAQQELD